MALVSVPKGGLRRGGRTGEGDEAQERSQLPHAAKCRRGACRIGCSAGAVPPSLASAAAGPAAMVPGRHPRRPDASVAAPGAVEQCVQRQGVVLADLARGDRAPIYGTNTPGFQTNFSGASVLYPVVRAVVGSNGGLGAACLLPLAFMLGASLLLYLTAARLFTRHAGLIAAASFAVLGQSSTWVPLLRMTRWRCCYWWRLPHLPHRPVPGLAVTELLTGVLLDMGPGTWLIFRRIHREEGG